MLVLKRSLNGKIIAGDITIVVVEILGSAVRLGIDAPREVPVHRKEIADLIVRERGPFPETRRVPVELLRRIIGRLTDIGASDATATLDAFELSKIINPPT